MAHPAPPPPAGAPPARRDASPLNWLLLVPVVLALAVPLYDKAEPRLAGIPFFYWFQLAVIPVGVLCTTLVHRAGARPGRAAARRDEGGRS